MKVLFAATEVAPISQAGGLGDVVQSLPLALHALGVESRIIIPFTTHIDLKKYECKQVHRFTFPIAGFEEEVIVWRTDYFKNVPVFILENKNFFHGLSMYGDFYGFNQPARYCFFSKAVIELIRGWDFVPDIILLDLVMPVMDGCELLQNIRKEKLVPNATVIILSNQNQASDIDRAKSLGVAGYIVKASSIPSEVVAEVVKVVNGNGSKV